MRAPMCGARAKVGAGNWLGLRGRARAERRAARLGKCRLALALEGSHTTYRDEREGTA